MLATIRRFTKTWPARLLFVVLVGAFGLWGVAGKLYSSSSDTAVAKVDGTRIEAAEAQRAYTQQMSQLTKQNGADFQPPPALRQQIAVQSVQQLVMQAALANEIKKLGIAVPDAAVRAETFSLAAFNGPSGKFDHATFLSVLSRNNLDEPAFIKLVRDDIAQQQLVGAVSAGAATSTTMVDQLFALTHETRIATAVSLPFDAAAKGPDPTDAQLRRYWANNPALYATPETRRIKVIVLSPQTLASDMKVSDDEIKTYYTASTATYDKPERRSVQVISAPDQATAIKLAAAWTANGDWGAIQDQAKAAGATPIELPNAKQIELPDTALAAAAFAAPIETISAPIQGGLGWYLVRVTAITPASLTTLAQAHDDIRAKIGILKANDAIDDRANKVEDALAGGGGLDDLPQGLGIAAVQGTLDAQGNTPEGQPAPLPAFPELRTAIIAAAFKANPGDAPHLEQLPATKENPAGAYYAVSVENIGKPAQLAYDQVIMRVRDDWTRAQQRHTQEAAAAALLTATRAGTPLATVAAQAKLTSITLPPVPRPVGRPLPPPDGVPENLVAPLFGMKQGDAGMVETPDGFMVAQLQSINIPAPSADTIGASQLRTSLNRSVATDLGSSFAQALQARSKVTFNDRLIQQIAQP